MGLPAASWFSNINAADDLRQAMRIFRASSVSRAVMHFPPTRKFITGLGLSDVRYPFNPELPGSLVEALTGEHAEATDKELAEATVREGGEQFVEAAGDPIISFSHVNISFNGRPVLEDVSFQYGAARRSCILGRSASANPFAAPAHGFLKADSGSIRFEGQEITSLSEEG